MAVTTSTAQSQGTWAKLVLFELGAPWTKNNIDNIVRWMAASNPPSHWWDNNNPLKNSTGWGKTNGTYASLTTAAIAVVRKLKSGTDGYGAIVTALKKTATPSAFSRAVVQSTWTSKHYGGNTNAIAKIAVPTFYPLPTTFPALGSVQPGTPGQAGGVSTGGGKTGTCLIKFPGVAGVGSFCVLSKEQANRVKGGLLVVAGGLGIVVALAVLAVYGLEGTVASRIGKAIAGSVPGGNKLTSRAGGSSPKPTPADEQYEGLPAATKQRIAAENRAQAREEARRAPQAGEEPFTEAHQSHSAPVTGAQHRGRTRERRPRASSRR